MQLVTRARQSRKPTHRVWTAFCILWLGGLFYAAPSTAETDLRLSRPLPAGLVQTVRAASRALSLSPQVSAADVIAAARGDYNRILEELYNAGHFGASVSITLAGAEATSISPFDRPASVRPILITIDPGVQFRFGTAHIHPLPESVHAPTDFAPDAPASTGVIQDAVKDGINAWRVASHATARVAGQTITANHSRAVLDAELVIDPGPKLSFGTLKIPSDSAVSPEAMSRIAGFPTSDPFHPNHLNAVKTRLLDSGAFQSVVLTPAERPTAQGRLDYTLAVADASPRRIGGGAEVSTPDGLSLEAFWMHRNAFGGAERFKADFAVKGLSQPQDPDVLLDLSLVIPGFRRPQDRLTFSIEAAQRFEPTFESALLSFGFIRQRKAEEHLTVGAGADIRISRVIDNFGTRNLVHFAPQFQATWDFRDDSLSARSGRYAQIGIRPFFAVNDAADDGLQLTADIRGYALVRDSTVLAGRLQLGQILEASRTGTPAEWLFTSGGGGTVRGLPYNSLGITDGNGKFAGGRGFLGLSAEIRQDITETIGFVGFVDAGLVSESYDVSQGDWHAGAGIGARYNTTLGPIRVDFALPLRGGDEGDFGLYIGIGQAF